MEPSDNNSVHFKGTKLLWSKVVFWLLLIPIILRTLLVDTIIDWCIDIDVMVAEETPSIL